VELTAQLLLAGGTALASAAAAWGATRTQVRVLGNLSEDFCARLETVEAEAAELEKDVAVAKAEHQGDLKLLQQTVSRVEGQLTLLHSRLDNFLFNANPPTGTAR